jgi:hypothetical protein
MIELYAPSEIEIPILRVLYPPDGSIPAAHVERVPEIRQHISALMVLASGGTVPKCSRRVLDPDESAALNTRIIELRETPLADGGVRTWESISDALGRSISPLAARKRYAAAKKAERDFQKLAEAALVKPTGDLPLGNPRDDPEKLKPDVELSGNPGQLGQEDKSAKPALTMRLFTNGKPIKDEWHLGESPCQEEGSAGNSSEYPNSSHTTALPDPDPEQHRLAPLTEAEIDAELIRLRDSGRDHKEIRDAMLHKGVDFGLAELRHRLAVLARKALPSKAAPVVVGEVKIPPNCTRPELDAVMWKLWNHGKGMTPDEISNILCKHGYSYGSSMVERRLVQQGAEL